MQQRPIAIATAYAVTICLWGLCPRVAGAVFELSNNHRTKVSGGLVRRTALAPNLQSVLYVTVKRTVERGGTSIAAVARLAGLADSSAQSAMRTLMRHGYVRLDKDQGYQASLESALQLWGSVARRGLSTGPIALGNETGHSIHAVAQQIATRHPVHPKGIVPRELETPEAYTVMMKLYRGRSDVGSIARYAGLEPGNVYSIVSRLAGRGYVATEKIRNAKTRRRRKEHSLKRDGEQALARGLWLGAFLPNLYVLGLVSQSLFENGPVVEVTHQRIANYAGERLTPHALTTLWCILYGGQHTAGAIAEVTGRRRSAAASTLNCLPSDVVKVVQLSPPGVTLGYWPNSGAESLHRQWHTQGGLLAGLGERSPSLLQKARELVPEDPHELLGKDLRLMGPSRASIHLGMAAGFRSLPELSDVLGLPGNTIHSHLEKSRAAGLARTSGAKGTPEVRFDNSAEGLLTLCAALAAGGYLPSVVREGLVTPARPWDE